MTTVIRWNDPQAPWMRDATYVDSVPVERHYTAVLSAHGLFWGHCSCGLRSLPYDMGGAAAQWDCPAAAAEQATRLDREAIEAELRVLYPHDGRD